MLRIKKYNYSLPEEIKFLVVATLAWCLLLSLARLQLFPQAQSDANLLDPLARCLGRIAFVSNSLESPIRHKIVAFGSSNSFAYSLVPSAVITSIDPSIKALEGSEISGLSYAIGRQPLRIQSDYLRLSLINLGFIDSTVLPVSMLSKLNNIKVKSIAIVEFSQDGCSNNGDLGLYRPKARITLSPSALEKYLVNFHPDYLPGYRKLLQ